MIYDYIIIGQGLAGSILSYQLIKKGKKVIVFDENKALTSSKVAAGIFNPITGKNLVKTWLADQIFPYLSRFYTKLEKELNTKFFYPQQIYRPFLTLQEQNDWMGRSTTHNYHTIINKVHVTSTFETYVSDQFGGIEPSFGGYLDTKSFIKSIQQYLIVKNAFRETFFDANSLEIVAEEVIYQSYKAKKIIFCEGTNATNNKYFQSAPFKFVHGELLNINSEKPLPRLFNRGVFILPIYNTNCIVGATYDHGNLSWEASEKGKLWLTTKLDKLLNLNYTIINHYGGIRPATNDRRPFIGLHPSSSQIGIFNGFGAKGVSLIPYLSHRFVQFLEQNEPLPEAANIMRVYK